MNYSILVLENDSKRITTFIELFGGNCLFITESPEEAVAYLSCEKIDYVFLNNKGEEVVTFIRDKLSYKFEVIIHTWNVFTCEKFLEILPSAQIVPYNSEDFFEIGEQLC